MASRTVPFTIAGIICFGTAFLLGAGFWYFFGSSPRTLDANTRTTVQTSNQKTNENNSNAANSNIAVVSPTLPPTVKKAPTGEALVKGGMVELGGGETKLPVRRINIADFYMGETEVSNAQYAEFIEATNHQAPANWRDRKFLPGTGDEPVADVSWADANAYCEWLGKELGTAVRLPTEAEWERAARGDTNFKYPWGNEWNDEAAQSKEVEGKIRPVRSLEAGRSPFGVYGMIGNVWEWTSDLAVNDLDEPILRDGAKQRIVKGGSSTEPRAALTIENRLARPEDKPSELLGFRYVVVRK
jgi:formylglycine-generating enzyme required for sulfatase activity